MSKAIADVVYDEKVNYTKGGFYSDPKPIKETKELKSITVKNYGTLLDYHPPEIPAGLRIGDRIYAYSKSLDAWLDARVTKVNYGANLFVEYITKEHIFNIETFTTNRVRLNSDSEIQASRTAYFNRNPQKRQN